MNNTLYITTILSWSFTWLATQYQLGIVPPAWSVAYRFGLAGILLLLFCLLSRRTLKFSIHSHLTMFLQGVFLFSLNFLMFYLGSQYLISGMAAVIFATITAMNVINARIFFKTPITKQLIIGTTLGCLGLILVFWSELITLLDNSEEFGNAIVGLLYCVLATFIASLGNMLSKYNQSKQIPVLQNNVYSMIYGAIVVGIVAMLFNQPITFDWSLDYVTSLFYLSIIGTIVGFGCYLKLLGVIGPERVGYVFVIVPVIAMTVSTFVEAFEWHIGSLLGVSLIVLGNYLVLTKKLNLPKEKCAALT